MPQVSPAVQKASTAPSAALLAEGAATGTAEEGAAEGDPPEAAVIRVGDLYFCAPPCVRTSADAAEQLDRGSTGDWQ